MSFTEVLAELAVNLRLDSSQFATGSNAAAGSARKLERNLLGLPKGLNAVTGALGGLAGGLAGGLLVGGVAELGSKLVELGKSSLEHAASLHATSQQLGVTTDDLQRYRFAASQVGLEQEKMDLGLKRLNKSVGLADRGLGPGAKAFAAMGISVRDASGHLKTVGEILPEVAGYISKLPDPAARAALEFQLFGRSGQDMAPLLNKGAEGVKNLTAAADKAGVVISPELIERAHELEVRFSKLKQIIETRVEVGLLSGLNTAASAAEQAGAQIDGFDRRLKDAQDRADAFDRRMGTPTKKEFVDSIGLGDNASIANFDKMLDDLTARADAVDKRLGIPSHQEFLASLWEGMNGNEKEGEQWRARLLKDFEDVSDTVSKLPADFERGWSRIEAATTTMVSKVETQLSSRLTPVLQAIEPKVKAAGDFFHNLYDRVVGHSYVPDMVDGIAAQMARLDAVMVAPVGAATTKAGDDFRELAGKLSALERELFPEAAAKNVLADNIDTLNAGLKAGALDQTQWLESLNRLMGGSAVTLNSETAPALQSVRGGIDDIGGAVESSPMLSWVDKVSGALEGLSEIVGKVFGRKAGGIFGAIVNAIGPIASAFGGGGFNQSSFAANESSNASALGLPTNFFHRALGGPTVPGRTYMVGENGPEYLTMGSRGYVTPPKGGNDNRRPYFDLRGAVMTTDLLRQMNQIGEIATGRGAVLGAAGAEERGARRARRAIP